MNILILQKNILLLISYYLYTDVIIIYLLSVRTLFNGRFRLKAFKKSESFRL